DDFDAAGPRQSALLPPLRRADRLLRVLLYRDGVQSDRHRRQSEEARRLRAGRQARRTDGAIYRSDTHAHHRARRALSGGDLPVAGNPDFLRGAALLFRRYVAADRRQRDDGYGGANSRTFTGPSIRRPDPQGEAEGEEEMRLILLGP